MDELDLDLEGDEINRTTKRINQLSNKVKEEAEFRRLAEEGKQKSDEEASRVAKERDFFKGFNQVATKYQGAGEYQDQIFQKVQAGYDIEDATVSVLAKEGKFTPMQETRQDMAAGGSADYAMSEGSKNVDQMSQDERRSHLLDLEKAGELRL